MVFSHSSSAHPVPPAITNVAGAATLKVLGKIVAFFIDKC